MSVPLVAIVDDEEDITTYLRIALEDEGYRVGDHDRRRRRDRTARPRREPDLICLDLLMPGQTGHLALRRPGRHSRLAGCPW